jgi:hypothetical protein
MTALNKSSLRKYHPSRTKIKNPMFIRVCELIEGLRTPD